MKPSSGRENPRRVRSGKLLPVMRKYRPLGGKARIRLGSKLRKSLARLPRMKSMSFTRSCTRVHVSLGRNCHSDIAELSKLRDRGMTNDEEVKLLALADHISKVATSRQKYVSY